MLRSIGKTCLAAAYTWSGADQLIAGLRNGIQAPFIAGYHRVVTNFHRAKTNTIPAMLISKTMLERHLDWLAKRFSLVSLDDVGLHLQENRKFRRPAAAITFDDGYSDVYHHAFPLLKKKGIPAAIFVVTGLIGTQRHQIFDRLYSILIWLDKRGLALTRTVAGALRSNGIDPEPIEQIREYEDEPYKLMTILLNAYPQQEIDIALKSLEESIPQAESELEEMESLTWDMIRTMHRSGIVIGSHTVSHCLLPSETIEKRHAELAASKQILEYMIGAPVQHFAYPDGRFNASVVRAVDSAGYRFAYGNCRFRDRSFPLLTIPRKVLWERSCLNVLGRFSSTVMNGHAHWLFDRGFGCEHDHNGYLAHASLTERYGRVA